MHRTRFLISTRTLPIRNLTVLKCGATRVRNVFYLLDNGHAYPKSEGIHSDPNALARASDFGLTHIDIAREEHAFVIMRHPTRRFLSLYFDKVIGKGTGGFRRLNRLLNEHRDFNANADTVLGHFKNCIVLSNIIEQAMQDQEFLPSNAHWTIQTMHQGVIKDCQLKVLLLENLDEQLTVFLRDIVPDIADKLDLLDQAKHIKSRNQSLKPISPDELMLPALIERIAEIYPRDQLHYDRAVQMWESIDLSTATAQDVPRLF